MPEEIWKPIKGFEGLYEVSNLGRCKSLPRHSVKAERIIKSAPNKGGYLQFCLRKNGDGRQYKPTVHRVVWVAFNGEIPEGLEINHIDGVKANNHLDNLEVVTPSENMQHALRIGLRQRYYARKKGGKLTNEQIREIRMRYIPRVVTIRQLGKEYGVHHTMIGHIVRRTSWKDID